VSCALRAQYIAQNYSNELIVRSCKIFTDRDSVDGGAKMAIERETIVTICCSDIAGQVRGKGFPSRDLEKRWRFGVGWTPTNIMINCFGRIPATPFGAVGDLMLIPAQKGDVVLDYGDGGPIEHMVLGDLVEMSGKPWECCLRGFLKKALGDLRSQMGLSLLVSFEHEFWMDGREERVGEAYSVDKLRGHEAFVGDFIGALRANNLGPETFLPEYGPRQFEVTIDPAPALTAADNAIKLREIARSVARRHRRRLSFSPMVTRGGPGNGVHIHFSLADETGAPVTYAADAPGRLSERAASFAAGILEHARALCAVTAPSVISYERLKPHSWSAYYTNIADRDREALLRVCPFPETAEIDAAKRFNLEYRGADAAASPYLQLGMLVCAGLDGLERALPLPPLSTGDPGLLSSQERRERGIGDLPRSLDEALDALEADTSAMTWLGSALSQAYVMHKRAEIEMTKGIDVDELLLKYAQAY
jgi:glutamine synthetase